MNLEKVAKKLAPVKTTSIRCMSEMEREGGILQMLQDLERLAKSDGCIAAAWALEWLVEWEPNECQECIEQLRTDEQIVDQTNELAWYLHKEQGFLVPEDFDFSRSKHPRAKMSWAMACIAQEILTDTDMEAVLQECEDGV